MSNAFWERLDRELAMYDMAEDIERVLGEVEAEPYRVAYLRIINADRPAISDAQVDALLAKGRQRLAEARASMPW